MTVYYATAWTGANIHYQPTGGTWTPVPGVALGI
ncbi:carbohydrate binding domain-containing protein [Streptosporangium roseum]